MLRPLTSLPGTPHLGSSDPLDVFENRIHEGKLKRDPAQLEVMKHYHTLSNLLQPYKEAELSQSRGFFRTIFGGSRSNIIVPKGLYVYGTVGR